MNVLVVLGHPRTDSFCAALADSYVDGAREAGVDVRRLDLAGLKFDPHVRTESPEEQPLEDDLEMAQRHIEWADHLAFVYPNWWGTMPALLKGFFDRVFTPGFAFSHYEDGEGAGHRKLLNDKTAELLVTMDTPKWVYRWILRQPGTNAVKRATLGYAGVRTTRVTNIGPVEDSSPAERDEWLERATRLGRQLADGPESSTTRAKRRVTTWLKALRLQFYPMAWIAYTVGALAATGSDGIFTSAIYWAGFCFLFFLEAATVLSNEYFDYETDRRNTFAGPFTGGSRVLVDGELDRSALRAGIRNAIVLTAIAALAALAFGVGSPLTMAAVMGVLAVLALGYTMPPLQLSYRTLGELDVAATHSVGVLLLGFVAFGGSWRDPLPWLLGLPFFLSILPSIILAGVPDYEADRAAGKETLAVRFGVDGAATVAIATALLAAATSVLLYAAEVIPHAYGPLVALSVPHAIVIGWLVRDRLESSAMPGRIDRLMAASLGYIVWFGVVPLLELL
ncbi:NAD(P)H-dependent oxidoreductase [Natrinema zhouii]|uniref:NAD(P)H-dependent oxidoreductase n=1 Tax=Natrinema zhouii TaxID=1710539 RepID=A0A7D6CRV2_9EURY|nr:NAD(P)H-dependent oxidoreductase [Natrinema zhouii]QLK27474.1 NAD(P)H-dependent oxidoreductase [Natrinema zhouii]